PLLTASVDPMPDVGYVDSMSGLNLRTRPPHVRSLVADASVVTIAVTTTVFADVAAILRSKTRDESKILRILGTLHPLVGLMRMRPTFQMTNDSILKDLYVCHDLTNHLAPPALFGQLRAMNYDQLCWEIQVRRNGNVVAAQAEGNAIGNNDLEEIEEANCILMANLQQASTSGTQSDKALIYGSDGSDECGTMWGNSRTTSCNY
ncbi:hypothetical protein Tco_1469382, partial [Tanacetum coccineum]